jgi:two-component system, OmpR family, sensor kinase
MEEAARREGDGGNARCETQALRELVQVKSDFLELTTHELRRPLSLVTGHLSLIREGAYGDVPEKMKSGLQVIEAGAVEMGTLVDALAGIAHLEDGGAAAHRRPTRFGHLVMDAVQAVELEAAAKGIAIVSHLPDPDSLVHIDRDLIRVAVINLLGNAIKYGPVASTVRVVAGIVERELSIEISDQGPGIDPVEAERIFDRWYRAPETTVPGLGLGLYLVQRIVGLHGGRVGLEPVPGGGSTFKMTLPS